MSSGKKLEIERKFLVKESELPPLPTGGRILQGYLSQNPDACVRVRFASECFLTIKGPGTLERAEFEYPISLEDAEALIKLCPWQVLKYRHSVYHGGKHWEVDVFDGHLKGLVVAEIELSHQHEKFDLPSWVGEEVTFDSRYANANLAMCGIPDPAVISKETG